MDSGVCQGHNRCIALAPESFDLDENGYASAAGDGTVPPENLAAVMSAVDNCPEEAIALDEDAGPG